MAIEGYPTIMVVEDDLDLRTIYKELLEHSGFTVADFSDGPAALAAIQKAEVVPKLILLDYRLPGMQGDQFLKELVNLPKIEKIPTILISALSSETPEIAHTKSHPWVTASFAKTDITNSKLVEFAKAQFGLE
jgi:CheY-like chemotaxis protein